MISTESKAQEQNLIFPQALHLARDLVTHPFPRHDPDDHRVADWSNTQAGPIVRRRIRFESERVNTVDPARG